MDISPIGLLLLEMVSD